MTITWKYCKFYLYSLSKIVQFGYMQMILLFTLQNPLFQKFKNPYHLTFQTWLLANKLLLNQSYTDMRQSLNSKPCDPKSLQKTDTYKYPPSGGV